MDCEKQNSGHERDASSRSYDGSWNLIWSADLAPKVNHHSWRMCRDSLPSCVNLVKHGLDVDPICPRCGGNYETTTQLVLDCNVSSQSWILTPFRIDPGMRTKHDAGDWCLYMLSTLQKEERDLFLTFIWAIWQGRNKWVFENLWKEPWEVTNLAMTFHTSYINAQEKKLKSTM